MRPCAACETMYRPTTICSLHCMYCIILLYRSLQRCRGCGDGARRCLKASCTACSASGRCATCHCSRFRP